MRIRSSRRRCLRIGDARLRDFDVPGSMSSRCTTAILDRQAARSSAAGSSGRSGCSANCTAARDGSSISPATNASALAGLLGINVRCHHLAWETMQGEAKRDYPASTHFQSAWWRRIPAVEDFFARLVSSCSKASESAMSSCSTQSRAPGRRFIPAGPSGSAPGYRLEALEQTYRDVFTWMSAGSGRLRLRRRRFLARLGGVTSSDDRAALKVGEATYRTVIVAGLVTMRESTLEVLRHFREVGGDVIFAGDAPAHLEAEPSTEPEEFASVCLQTPLTSSGLVDAVSHSSCSPFRIDAPSAVLCQVRRDQDCWLIALANTEPNVSSEVRLTMRGEWSVESWNCETGARSGEPAICHAGGTRWETDLAPIAGPFLSSPRPTAPRVVVNPPPDRMR